MKKNLLRPNFMVPISLLIAGASTLLYARGRRRMRQSDIGSISGPSDPSIMALLQAYRTTINLAEDFPPKPRIMNLSRPFVLRSYLRFAVIHHIKQTLGAIRASYYAREALGESTDERDSKAVEDFLASIPDISFRRLIFLTVSAGVVLAAFLSISLKLMLGTVGTIFVSGSEFPLSLDVNIDLIVSLATAVPTLDLKSIVDAFEEAGWLNSVTTIIVIIVAFIYALIPPMSSFQATRAYFSHYPDAIEKLRLTKNFRRIDKPQGVYSLENEYFGDSELGSPAKHNGTYGSESCSEPS